MLKPASEKLVLPSPADHPNKDIVIFDGQCRFCRAQVQRLAKWDWNQHLTFLSLHDPMVKQRWADLSHDQLMAEMYLIERDERRSSGAAAFRRISCKLPPLWIVMPVLHLPGSLPLWRFLYRQVARYRYRFGKVDDCDGDTCRIHFD